MKPNITPEKKNEIYTAMLMERLCKIHQIIAEQGEEKFVVSFSGGKDSTVMSHLIDEALPDNKIPRVYANTGIEYNEIIKFVKELQEHDDRIVILKPTVPIKQMLERDGYPFKSKMHSGKVAAYQKNGESLEVQHYLGKIPSIKSGKWATGSHKCPKMLEYQFTPDYTFKLSDLCCDRLKKEPMKKYQKETGRIYPIIGIMPEEGGQRQSAKCLVFKGNRFKAFQPLVPLSKDWEDWYIARNNIKLCSLYYPPYNFDRTGCKGCPFNPHLQRELDTLDKYFQRERAMRENMGSGLRRISAA